MKFRKKAVVIEAQHFTLENKERAFRFISCTKDPIGTAENPEIAIQTLEGTMVAKVGDWIIKGINGEFYPCKPDIFEMTYEKVEEEDS